VLLTVAVGLAGVVGLGACSSSDAGGDATVPRSIATVTATEATAPAATQPPVTTSTVAPVADTVPTTAPAPTTTSVAPTTAPAQADSEALVLTDQEVADFERELDEIDQLLAGVDADLSQD
jgi:hypothetical protein